MIRILTALLGLAVIGALFAGVYYGAEGLELRESRPPAFNIAPGEVRVDFLEPSIAGGPITVHLDIQGPPIDVYVMDEEWVARLTDSGTINLSQPFSFHREFSRLGVNGSTDLAVVADGETRLALVLDHSDNHYANDTIPEPHVVGVKVTTRYLDEERRSLTLGYLAATPSVILVGLTIQRRLKRAAADKKRLKHD